MTQAVPPRKLKQPRLGTLQKKVLRVLAVVQGQRRPYGEAFNGLLYRDLQARLYNQAVLIDGQWLQTVYAQMLVEQGQINEANQLLFKGIELVTSFKTPSLDRSQTNQSFSAGFNASLTARKEEVERIGNTAFLLRNTSAEVDPMILHSTLIGLAREAASFIAYRDLDYYRNNGFLTLSQEQRDAAEKALTVQHASLSRALRLLEAHGLIAERVIDRDYFKETRYFVTSLGIQRLQSEARKMAAKG